MNTRAATGRVPAIPDTILARLAWRLGLAALERIRVGCLTVVLPDGSEHVVGDRSSDHVGEIRIHDSAALVRMLVGGETGAGEAYMDGLWSSPDLAALIAVAALNRESLALSAGWWRAPAELRRIIAHRLRRNTRSQSRRNISAHYDLGNDFFRLFLDETMTYSSAVFASPDQSLSDAQRNKYRLIAEGAGLGAGQHVLEIGSGWGGFALYAAGEAVVKVDVAEPWKIVKCSRASWYRFMASGEAPAGMCLKLGRGRRLALGPFIRWIGADDAAGDAP